MDLEEMYNNLYFKEDIVKESEKLPNKVKISLQKGKTIDKEWEEEYKLNNTINDCINIENNIKDINIINENINKSKESFNLKVEFIPEIQINKNNIFEEIKNFGKIYYTNIKYINFLENSLIIKKNYSYIENIKNWINSKNSIKAKLLYRKSIDGDSYETFHKLCDNKGPTLILIKSNENFIIGGYTPLNWDMNGEWKVDNDTFLFNLTNNKIFRKKEKMKKSIFCSKECGPWFPFIGFLGLGKKNMSQGDFFYKTDNNWIYFNDINNIIPNEGKDKLFDIEEVEIYQILFN